MIADIIQKLHLNKTDTNLFLQFPRNFTNNYQIPSSNQLLWEQLNINFDYSTTYFCSNLECLQELRHIRDKCFSNSCNSGKVKVNSELIVFSVKSQLRRVVMINHDLMGWYSMPHHQYEGDIVKSKHPH
jgi:hypothetical protein